MNDNGSSSSTVIKVPSTLKYLRTYRKYMDSMFMQAAVFGIASVICTFSVLVVKWENSNGWLRFVPCIFQPELKGYAEMNAIAKRILDVSIF